MVYEIYSIQFQDVQPINTYKHTVFVGLFVGFLLGFLVESSSVGTKVGTKVHQYQKEWKCVRCDMYMNTKAMHV